MSDNWADEATKTYTPSGDVERAMAGLPASDEPAEFASMTDVQLAQWAYSVRWQGNELLPSVIHEWLRTRRKVALLERFAVAQMAVDAGITDFTLHADQVTELRDARAALMEQEVLPR